MQLSHFHIAKLALKFFFFLIFYCIVITINKIISIQLEFQ